jgi:outer membrane protein assembly factor BamB
MKILATPLLTLLLTVTPATAQLVVRQWSNPRLPARRDLERLNLKMAWRVYLPVATSRDGIHTVHLLPKQMFVQTVSGLVVALDPDTGVIEWQTRVGRPYQGVNVPLGFNRRSVFAVRADKLYSLDRTTGKEEWVYTLPTAGAAAPVADDDTVYIGLASGWVYAYLLPDLAEWRKKNGRAQTGLETVPSRRRSLDPEGRTSGVDLENIAQLRRNLGPQPEVAWQYLFEAGQTRYTPRQTEDTLIFTTHNGYIFTLGKDTGEELYRFKASGPIVAPMGLAGNTAYVGSDDFNCYGVDAAGAHLDWRFTAGSAVRVQPAATDDSVYVACDRALFRLDRGTGREVWRSTDARRFLAANRKFVYAFDRHGRLVVVDRDRGTRLGRLDTRDYVYPIPNDLTDRLFLAAHNGLLVCLHDLDQKTPLVVKKVADIKGYVRRQQQRRPGGKTEGEGRIKPKEKPKEDKEGKEGEEGKEEKEDMKKDKEDGKDEGKPLRNRKEKKKDE